MAKQYLDIVKSVMRIDTNSFSFDMQQIENRRFMFNPQTGTLILGYQYSRQQIKSSHAAEHADANIDEAFDSFIRGWIGTGKEYQNGIIHFSPNIPTTIIPMFEKGFDTLEMFAENGANKNTVVRAFGEVWEQPLSELIKEVDYMAENTKTHSLDNLIEFGKDENTKERVEKLTGILEQELTNVFESENYKRYLSAMAVFHKYSFRNTMLILHQLPNASYIAGFNAWKDLNRYVKEGEKAIKIFAPAPYKTKIDEIQRDGNGEIIRDGDGNPVTKEKEITVPAFKAAPVYDISQTDGEPLPELGGGELVGTVENYEEFWAVLKKISPFPIELIEFEPGDTAQGYCHYGEDAKITVRNDMSEIETIAAAVHEISHAKLHNYTIEELALLPPEEKKTRRMREVEAESVAFVVCKHFGIETGESSFPYIASWSKDKEMPELKASLSTIQKTSAELIDEIEENLISLEKEQVKSKESVMSQLPPEKQEEIKDAVKDTLQTLADADIKAKGEISEGTKSAAAVQGYEINAHGDIVKKTSPDIEPTKVHYYTINESAAKHAKMMYSFSDYVPGSETAAYRAKVDKAVEIADKQKKRVDKQYHKKIDRLLDTYARKLAENTNKGFEIEMRCPSVMIAGASNFPVGKKIKQNAARDRNMEEWQYIEGLLDKIRSTGMGGISADDPQAIAKLKDKLEHLQAAQQMMKDINAYYRKHKTLDGCTILAPEEMEKIKSDMAQSWHLEDKPFASYSLTNNNAEISRVKKRIEELEKKALTTFPGWEFDGGTVEANKAENRLQILFDDKPSAEVREQLKSNGFRWSPKANAWQRQLNRNAYYACDYVEAIKPLSGEKPSEIMRNDTVVQAAPEQEPDIFEPIPETVDMSTKVGEWYMKEHSADGAGSLINSDITFEDLYNAIGQSDVYKLLGVGDSVIRENCFAKLAEIQCVDYTEIYNKWLGDTDIPDMFNPKIQPVVSIEMTESAALHKGMQLPLHKADDLFKQLDYVSENGQIEKTRFTIDYVYKCELTHYEGYYYFGEDTGGIINHIEKYFEENMADEQLIAFFKEKGPEELEKFNARNEYGLKEFVPYMQLHKNLAEMEAAAMTVLNDDNASMSDKAYANAICDYVHNSRTTLNLASEDLKLPDAPKKEDFIMQSVSELEETAKSGTPISLLDLAESVKTEKAIEKKTGKKPSIKKQLEKDKEKKADEPKPKKTTKKKSQDLEV